jgi:hypothetical protein
MFPRAGEEKRPDEGEDEDEDEGILKVVDRR